MWKNSKNKWSNMSRSVHERLQYGCIHVTKDNRVVSTSEKHSRKEEKRKPVCCAFVCNTPPELYLEMHFTWNQRKWKIVGDCPVVLQEMRSVFVIIRTAIDYVGVVQLQKILSLVIGESKPTKEKRRKISAAVRKTRPLSWMLQRRATKIVHVCRQKIESRLSPH